jgi:hypothetical protein
MIYTTQYLAFRDFKTYSLSSSMSFFLSASKMEKDGAG